MSKQFVKLVEKVLIKESKKFDAFTDKLQGKVTPKEDKNLEDTFNYLELNDFEEVDSNLNNKEGNLFKNFKNKITIEFFFKTDKIINFLLVRKPNLAPVKVNGNNILAKIKQIINGN